MFTGKIPGWQVTSMEGDLLGLWNTRHCMSTGMPGKGSKGQKLDILMEMVGNQNGKKVSKLLVVTCMVLLWALSTGTEKELELSRKLDKTKGTAFREGCLDSMFCHLGCYIKIMTGRTY